MDGERKGKSFVTKVSRERKLDEQREAKTKLSAEIRSSRDPPPYHRAKIITQRRRRSRECQYEPGKSRVNRSLFLKLSHTYVTKRSPMYNTVVGRIFSTVVIICTVVSRVRTFCEARSRVMFFSIRHLAAMARSGSNHKFKTHSLRGGGLSFFGRSVSNYFRCILLLQKDNRRCCFLLVSMEKDQDNFAQSCRL